MIDNKQDFDPSLLVLTHELKEVLRAKKEELVSDLVEAELDPSNSELMMRFAAVKGSIQIIDQILKFSDHNYNQCKEV